MPPAPKSGSKAEAKTRAPIKRDAAKTRQQILAAAVDEFSKHGFSGARIETIVQRAKCNIRMAYHYFKDKEGLYVAVLESVYEDIRSTERNLNLAHLEPAAAMKKLVSFTVDHFAAHPDFVRLTNTENLQKGKYIKTSKKIPAMSSPLIDTLRTLLKRGEAEGVFRKGTDALRLYITIVALSCHHLNNRYTLSATFQTDIGDAAWQEAWKAHVGRTVMAMLLPRS